MKNTDKRGFTIVELMVVIVIIGILAAVAMPRFGDAADRARAAEAGPILAAIATGQEVFRLVNAQYLALPATDQTLTSADSATWRRILPTPPSSNIFSYSTTIVAGNWSNDSMRYIGQEFIAEARLITNMRRAQVGDVIRINQEGQRVASAELRRLIPTFNASEL